MKTRKLFKDLNDNEENFENEQDLTKYPLFHNLRFDSLSEQSFCSPFIVVYV